MLGEVEIIFFGFAVLLVGVGFLIVLVRLVAAIFGGLYRMLAGPAFPDPRCVRRAALGMPRPDAARLVCRDVCCRHLNRAGAMFCSQCGQRL
ncbi:MAG TPA: hypothetical protein VGM03_13120 [Phycisphaerae bacterium]|jgi:hypothetical protein